MRTATPLPAGSALLAVLVLLVPVAGWAAEGAGPDSVKVRGEGAVRGTITALTPEQVVISEAAGKARTLLRTEVDGWTLGEPPAGLRDAERAVESHDWKAAISACRAALSEIEAGKARAIHRPFVELSLARAQRASGDLDGALASVRGILGAGGRSAIRPQAVQEAMEIARQKKDRAGLIKLLDELSLDALPEGALAGIERARLALEDSDTAKAHALLFAIIEKCPEGKTASEALLLDIRCLARVGKKEDLEAACRKGLSSRLPFVPSLAQAAGSMLGEVLLERAGEDPPKVREALAAARTAVSWGQPQKEGLPGDYGRALLTAARACRILSGKAGAPEAKAEYRAQGASLCREVSRALRGTDWAKLAEAELAAWPEEKVRS